MKLKQRPCIHQHWIRIPIPTSASQVWGWLCLFFRLHLLTLHLTQRTCTLPCPAGVQSVIQLGRNPIWLKGSIVQEVFYEAGCITAGGLLPFILTAVHAFCCGSDGDTFLPRVWGSCLMSEIYGLQGRGQQLLVQQIKKQITMARVYSTILFIMIYLPFYNTKDTQHCGWSSIVLTGVMMAFILSSSLFPQCQNTSAFPGSTRP